MPADLMTKPDRRLARLGRQVAGRLDAHPYVQAIETEQAELYCYQEFLAEDDCALLMQRIDEGAEPSTTYRSAGYNQDFRTSYSCHLNRYDADVERVELRICQLLGIHPRFGETVQGQRYQVGQQFKPHNDFFHTSQYYWEYEKANGGQRSWTAMVFLNEPEAGGETEFPKLGLKVLPRTGMLLAWNNLGPDGAPNFLTLHSGNPVVAGTKYVITKWFRREPWLRGKT